MVEGRVTIERTYDGAIIKALATHPTIFPHISDDYFREPREWRPIMEDFIFYLVAGDGEGHFGFGIFVPRTYSCAESHLGFLPRSYGEQALEAFRGMLAWMWMNTSVARIVGEIPSSNHRAIAFARRAGYEIYGVNQKSRLRGGKLEDQVCLGISKV